MSDGDDKTSAILGIDAKSWLTIGLALLGLWIMSGFLPALIWAAVIAIAIDPLFLWMRQRGFAARHPALLSISVTLAIAIVLIVPIAIGIGQAAVETRIVIAWIGEAQRNGIPVPVWAHQLPAIGEGLATWWQANLATPEGAALQWHHFNTTNWMEHSRLIGAGLIHRSVIFAFTLIALFFLLRDRDAVVDQAHVVSARLFGQSGNRILRQTVLSIRGTIDGLVFVGIGEGAVMTVVYIILSVPHPLLLGGVTAIAAIIPFGAALMFVIAAALLLMQGAALAAVVVIVLGLVVVGIADHFVRPVLIGSATRLPFLWVLIGILGGVETFSLVGLFVGPATMAILYMMWRDFVDGAAQAETTRR